MLLFFLSSLLFLSASLPLDKLQLKSSKSDVMNSIQMLMKNETANPKALIKTLENIDPTAVAGVVTLVEALLASSNADLLALQQASATANTNYDDTTNAYNAAVAEKERLDTVIATRNSDLTHQLTVVQAALTAQTLATGAKTNAQSTLDSETTRLNHEIATLQQVLALLGRLDQSGWSLFEGKYYKALSETRSWDASRQECQNLGGDLASIHSSSENDFIQSLGSEEWLWIGGRDLAGNNQVYTWSDGSSWSYTKWYPNEPNSNNEHCVMMYAHNAHEGKWNDLGCTGVGRAVCKR